jgi:hypothetical protein
MGSSNVVLGYHPTSSGMLELIYRNNRLRDIFFFEKIDVIFPKKNLTWLA